MRAALKDRAVVYGRRWITLIGTPRVSTDPDEIVAAVARYTDRYRPPRPNPTRVAIAVSITGLLVSPTLVAHGTALGSVEAGFIGNRLGERRWLSVAGSLFFGGRDEPDLAVQAAEASTRRARSCRKDEYPN